MNVVVTVDAEGTQDAETVAFFAGSVTARADPEAVTVMVEMGTEAEQACVTATGRIEEAAMLLLEHLETVEVKVLLVPETATVLADCVTGTVMVVTKVEVEQGLLVAEAVIVTLL